MQVCWYSLKKQQQQALVSQKTRSAPPAPPAWAGRPHGGMHYSADVPMLTGTAACMCPCGPCGPCVPMRRTATQVAFTLARLHGMHACMPCTGAWMGGHAELDQLPATAAMPPRAACMHSPARVRAHAHNANPQLNGSFGAAGQRLAPCTCMGACSQCMRHMGHAVRAHLGKCTG